jgi:hypothetical protein
MLQKALKVTRYISRTPRRRYGTTAESSAERSVALYVHWSDPLQISPSPEPEFLTRCIQGHIANQSVLIVILIATSAIQSIMME